MGLHALPRDLAYSLRMIVKRPWFTLAAVAVLALGIGANTAIFSLVNSFLLRPLVLGHPEQLIGVFTRDTRKPDTYRAFSYPNYADLRAGTGVFSSLAAQNMSMVGLSDGDTTRRMFADIVSSNYFETLGVPLWRGRTFTEAEERPGSRLPVVIVSYSYWKRHSAEGDPVGRTIKINGQPVTVVGVTAPGFTGTMALVSMDLYLPLGMYGAMMNDFAGGVSALQKRDNNSLLLVGRLRPGMTRERADKELAGVAKSMADSYPAENHDQGLIVRPLSRLSMGTNPQSDSGLAIPATLLLCMAAVVLLIAALNVANMMLARGTARRKEIAIRLALGGGRGGIVQQLFMEGLVLAMVGGAVGLVLSYVGTTLLMQSMGHIAPVDLAPIAGPDLRVLSATLGFCLLSTLLFSFVPAWNLSRPSLVTDLRASDNAELPSGKRRLFARRNLLAIAQVALSLMLLTAAGLFVRSAGHVTAMDPGFQIDNGVLVEMDASLAGYDETRGRQLYAAVRDRLAALPGVESVSLGAIAPFGMVALGREVRASESAASAKPENLRFNIVGEDYFRTLSIPLLRGRAFVRADGSSTAPQVAILDKLAAQRLWPGGDAVGKHIRMTNDDSQKDVRDLEVVGVVGGVVEHVVGREADAHIYVPFGAQYMANMHLHLRTTRPPDTAFLSSVRQEIRAVDNGLPVLALTTLRSHMEASIDYWVVETGARMFSIFGGIALLLAVIGLYGVRAYNVARRTREIGIRMALGASSAEAQRMVLGEGLRLLLAGGVVGLVLSLLVGKVLAGMLYQVSGADPLVFSVSLLVLGSASLLACYFPARRAARIDPMVALRYE